MGYGAWNMSASPLFFVLDALYVPHPADEVLNQSKPTSKHSFLSWALAPLSPPTMPRHIISSVLPACTAPPPFFANHRPTSATMPSLYNIIRDLWAVPCGGRYPAPPRPPSSHTLSAGSNDSPPRTPGCTPQPSSSPACVTPPRWPVDPDDYLDALRPRSILRRTRRLPDTPTKSHWPPARHDTEKRSGKKKKKAFRCPECRCRIVLTPGGGPSKESRKAGEGGSRRGVSSRLVRLRPV